MRDPSPRSSTPAAPASKASAAAISARAASRSTRITLVASLLALTSLSGCYYAHLARGQLALFRAERPLEQVIDDASTPSGVRDALRLVPDVLAHAESIGLRVGRQYRDYAAWPGDRIVTAVVATEPGRLEPHAFWFPIVGRAPYKGFFELARAEREAASLRARGLETCLVPVPAYSTLGWLADPVTQPMLRGGVGRFVEMLLHELVHATLFVAGDADWNESVATFVGQEAAVRFFEARGDAAAAAAERARVDDERAVAARVGALRARIAALYAAPPAGDRATARAALEAETRAEIAALPLRSRDAAALAAALPLTDPCIALDGTYEQGLPLWAARLDAEDGDLVRFVAAAARAAETSDPHAALRGDGTAAR